MDVVGWAPRFQAIGIIGEQQLEPRSVLALAYDNTGAMTLIVVRVDTDGVWTFAGGLEVAPTAQPAAASPGGVRATLTVAADRRT